MIGTTIAHYKITSKLGQGGMGEVFLARDTKLDREVALKFLPLPLQQDESARIRFIREAKAVAALDHPFICSIYEVGETDDGQNFIAMEYVAGQTLREKLEDGPIPLNKALPILIEAAEAIEKAHSAGFVHRDLKPANLMLTPEGHVKVMDFGLAKRILSQGATEQEITAGLTREGSTLGTLSYMSPEQIRGEELDSRSDIFSFGVILYEILTGKHPFRRRQPMETAAATMKEQAPPLGRFLGDAPYRLELTVGKLLSKEPERRYQLIHEVKIDLEDVAREISSSSASILAEVPTTQGPSSTPSRSVLWVFGTLLFAPAFLLTVWSPWEGNAEPKPEPLRQLDVKLSPEVKLAVDGGTGPAAVLSPDGSSLAFVGESEDRQNSRIYVRQLDNLEATPLPGTEGSRHPVFSPDGNWIAFRTSPDLMLKKISKNGGAPVELAPTQLSRGLDWADDGSIIYTPSARSGLSKVSSDGGLVKQVTSLAQGEISHSWPQVLPGGEAILYTALHSGQKAANIIAERFDGSERKTLWQGGYFARYLTSGHLVYTYSGTLFAAGFNPETLELKGQPIPILVNVLDNPAWARAEISFSGRGTVVYLPGYIGTNESRLEWMDLKGNYIPLLSDSKDIDGFRLSPDGNRVALTIEDGRQRDIWIFDWRQDSLNRLTFNEADDSSPVWNPNGEVIAFRSNRDGSGNIYWKLADGSGEARPLTQDPENQTPYSWHPSGEYLAIGEHNPERLWDIRILKLEANDQTVWKAVDATTLVSSPVREAMARFSPDGRWIAYHSYESGSWEVFVLPFPGPGGKRQVSTEGGVSPSWSSNRKELFYSNGNLIFRVPYHIASGAFQPGKPEGLSYKTAIGSYDPHPDGHQIAIMPALGSESMQNRDSAVFIDNFFDYLREKVPVDQ